jgi:hypothetical protein
LDDLKALALPKETIWKNDGLSWLAHVYDWDVILVDQTAELSVELDLCVGLAPCSVWIRGNPLGNLRKHEHGQILCRLIAGCSDITIDSVVFNCFGKANAMSLFKVQGSNLTIFNSSFNDFLSFEDGGVIQSYDKASVDIKASIFHNSHSSGFGGAWQFS